MAGFCQNYTAQTCWVINNQVQTNNNSDWLKTHDLEQYYVGSNITYRGIPKIPKEDYPIVEKEFYIWPYVYNDVPYVVIKKKPTF